MGDWLEGGAARHGLVFAAAIVILIATAFGIINSASVDTLSIELLLIMMLLIPAVCLPALAFKSHAREKEKAAQIIRTQNHHFNKVMENMTQGLCMFDGNQRLIVCNHRYAEMYGLGPELVRPGTSFRDILDSRVENGSFSGDEHEAYVQERLDAVAERVYSTKVQQLRDGRYIAITHSPMSDGGWLATHEDITEMKKAERAAEENEARFRAIFDNSPFCLNLKDVEGRYLFANKRYEEYWGHPVEDIIGKKAEDFHTNHERVAALNQSERQVVETGETHQTEVNVLRPSDGEMRDRWLIKFPVKTTDGDLIGLGTFAVDVTERKKAEAELIRHRDHLQELVDNATQDLKMKAKELEVALEREKELNELQRQFVSMASHEFRTPLAIIDSTAQRLKKCSDRISSEEAFDKIDKIRGAVQRMMRLMESTLNAARMEEGKIAVTPQPCDLKEIIADACHRMQELSQHHVILCETRDLPETIVADPGALDQMLTNLISNAVKYSPGTPEVRVAAYTDGADVVVDVEDGGLGIDKEDLPKMFGRFFRAKTSAGITGTGIGLNLVKTLVEMHDGSICVDSRKGEGSVFTLRLPIAGPTKDEKADIKVA